jgi:hypothetical protein
MIEATRIAPGLYQGSQPPPGDHVRMAGFSILVLCAGEYQPPAACYPGVTVLHCPLIDNGGRHRPTEDELRLAYRTGHDVAQALSRGRRVLVTCQAGLNRSGMVTAIALHALHGNDGASAVKHVQITRPGALFNGHFARAIEALPPRKPRPGRPK